MLLEWILRFDCSEVRTIDCVRESGEVSSGLTLSEIRLRVPPVTTKREDVNGESASAERLNVSVLTLIIPLLH